MSDLDTKAIKARLAAYNKYRWYFCPKPEGHEGCLCDNCVTASSAHHEYNGHSQEDIAALLAENAALRARLTLTPERIEAAAKAIYDVGVAGDSGAFAWKYAVGSEQKTERSKARAALLAAGMEEKA